MSTLGMPGIPVRESAAIAAAHGCAGLELRVHADEEVHLGLKDTGSVRDQISEAGLEISALAGYVQVCAPGIAGELRALIDLAARLNAPAIRVFPGGTGEDGRAVDQIAEVLPDLTDSGVQLLVETHDSHLTAESVLRLVKPFADPARVAVLWDALHPWRAGEAPARTRALLGEYLGYFQLKDATAGLTPVPPGEGMVPLGECGRLLRSWSGWISLEWERAWHPEIAPVDVPLRAAADWLARWRG
ncbi:sugar phosphate isomerase/epimerase [Amycolatopsis sp. FU40]|uniref:sugar phosphate isomerase/epimerase family protein n=1 Tax=Amycolatopsis sp. FU40 TaxID=2914159 RepID=UPI001F41B708|nr:sugar phosphate isomerase/epimerase family protein [Amycolatopsis sp. FU40]UKD54616.1 sugar phosphate isomerase/epimerase [Amycolatopsis sp. FU40]